MSASDAGEASTDRPDWAGAVDVIDDLMADQHVIGYPLEWLRTVLVAASELARERDEALSRADTLYGTALNLQKENGDLALDRELAVHTFHANGGGAIVRELNEIHDLLGAEKKTSAIDAVRRVVAERDEARRELERMRSAEEFVAKWLTDGYHRTIEWNDEWGAWWLCEERGYAAPPDSMAPTIAGLAVGIGWKDDDG